MVDVWSFYLFTTQDYYGSVTELPAGEAQDAFDNWTSLIAKSENWGIDGAAFAEHHFMTAAVAPSPHLVIANLAGRTKKMKFTVLGSVLTMNQMWRYVAECGMLDALTHGRFEPGIGAGSGPKEAVMAGYAEAEARPRYESGAAFLEASLSEAEITFKDEFLDVYSLGILPRWQPKPGQSVWATVMSHESAGKYGARGWKICTGWMPNKIAGKVADAYRAGAEEAGRKIDPSMIGLRRRVFVADSDAEAQEKFEEAESLMPFLLHKSKGSKMEAGDERILQMVMNPDDFAVGSPKTVADKLVAQCEEGGFGMLSGWHDFASFRWADFEKSHRLYGTEVGPILRKANVGAGTTSGTNVDETEFRQSAEVARAAFNPASA
jgi:alkanesulfonate monooxygenase SsuD/methylene tetrahydromethanopterin reductase-like flavin-dependent oxidoreductase (luciferase family)